MAIDLLALLGWLPAALMLPNALPASGPAPEITAASERKPSTPG